MTNSENVEYLISLVDTDPYTTVQKKQELRELILKLDTGISREEKFQIMILIATLLFEYINKGGLS